MEIYEAIRTRRSVRAYKPDPVPEEALGRVLEAARLAPSGGNRQPWKFIVVRDESLRMSLVPAAHNQAFIAQAPIVIAAVGLTPDRMMSCDVAADAVDLAIAVDHITLAAVAEGLGTCWIGAFDQNRVRELLGVPPEHKVVALLPLGYPADEPRPKSRKELSEIVCYDRFA
jgi:nitroreductase